MGHKRFISLRNKVEVGGFAVLAKRGFGLIGAATIAFATASPSLAQVATPTSPAPVTPLAAVPADVTAFYSAYTVPKIWFRDGVENPAVGQLVTILQRAPFDGFADGPQLAAQVQFADAARHLLPRPV